MKSEKSTGNVFLDIGFEEKEAANLLIRADLMIEITKHIRKAKITQAQAAKLLDVTQPRISDLMRGKIELFTIDMLVNMLTRAGKKVALHVEKASKKKVA